MYMNVFTRILCALILQPFNAILILALKTGV